MSTSDTPLPLDEAVELVGEWWLPGQRQEEAAIGRLTYAPRERLQLDVTSGHGFHIGYETPIVLGLTVEGRPVTLVDVQLANSWTHIPGGVRTVSRVGMAFVGLHANSRRELRLHDLRARMSHLTEWLGITAIDLGKITFFPDHGPASWHTPNVVGLARVRRALLTASFEMVGDRDGRHRAHNSCSSSSRRSSSAGCSG